MRKKLLLICLNTLLCAETIKLAPIEVKETALYESVYEISADSAAETRSITLQDRLQNDVAFNVVPDIKGEEAVSFRGFDFRATEYVQDGIPIYRSVNGFVDTKFIMSSSDIYVNDGSGSSTFGVSSMGGEVQIDSKIPIKPLESKLDTTVSTNDEYYHGYIGSKKENVYFQADIGYYHRSNYELSERYDPTQLQDSGSRINSDKQQQGISIKSGVFIDDIHLAVKASTARSEFGMPPNVFTDITAPVWDAYSRIDKKTLNSLYLYGDYTTDDIVLNARVYYDEYEDSLVIYNEPTYESFWPKVTYDDSRIGTVLKATINDDDYENSFVLQVEQNEHIRKGGDLETEKFQTETFKGAYMYKAYLKKNWELDAAVSYTLIKPKEDVNNKETGDAQVKISYMGKKNTLYVGVAKKSRMPSMNEMFSFFPWEVANATLKPEKSMQYTTGYKQMLEEKTSVEVALYYYDVDDLIVYRNVGYINLDKAEQYGIDMRMDSKILNNHHLRFSYAFSHTRDSENNPLELIPEHRIKMEDTMAISKGWDAYLSYQYFGSRYSSNTATYTDEQKKLNTYRLFDLQAIYTAIHKTTLRFGVKNLFDEACEWKYGYPTEGRSYYISLEWKFN